MIVEERIRQTMWLYAVAAALRLYPVFAPTLASKSLAATPAVLCSRARSSSLALDRLSLAIEGAL